MADLARDRTTAVVATTAVRALVIALIGAVLGLLFALLTPAKVEVAGSSTSVYLRFGQSYDQFGVQGGVLTLKRPTPRAVLGEPLGVRAVLHLDASELTSPSGSFDVNVLPAYIQAYSDPQQLVSDIQRAIVIHFLVFGGVGALLALLVWVARIAYRTWRRRYDATHWPDGAGRRTSHAYLAPERRGAKYLFNVLAVLVVCTAMPASAAEPSGPPPVVPNPLFAGTPLDGIEVDGLLRPAIEAVGNYIETYYDQTNTYYDQLRTKLLDQLDRHPADLPGDSNSVQLGFVSDRHCNIGMDRVIVGLLDHYDIKTLVSGGDDAFSGSFGFESACTRNIADKTARSDIEDVFVGGNHDSPQTIEDEKKQGIKTLTDDIVDVHGLHFVGVPDPRTSRYGQGIEPSSDAAQQRLLIAQGEAAGKKACSSDAPVIAVLHDPLAGQTALEHGCGKVVLALDGHTHAEAKPVAVANGYQFTSGSTGGAPGESAVESTFASRLTVGPLNHDAWITIVTVDKSTARLQGVTGFHFRPDQTISVTQQRIG